MMRLHVLAACVLLAASASRADVTPGISFDFESGTTEGWGGGADPSNVADGGPNGAGDAFLQFGNGGRLAAFNTDLSGVLDSEVTSIQVDLNRPAELPDLEVRLVLFGPDGGLSADRWTSSTAAVVPGNGEWATYTFSVLEADLTQVRGIRSYAEMAADLDRIMLRHDPGTPSAGGASTSGTLGVDNFLVLGGPTLQADINGDGAVDLLDLDILGQNFGASPATPEQGDLNGDNTVDLLDLDILGQEFGSGSGDATPEPTAALLMAIGAATICARRHRS